MALSQVFPPPPSSGFQGSETALENLELCSVAGPPPPPHTYISLGIFRPTQLYLYPSSFATASWPCLPSAPTATPQGLGQGRELHGREGREANAPPPDLNQTRMWHWNVAPSKSNQGSRRYFSSPTRIKQHTKLCVKIKRVVDFARVLREAAISWP